MGTCIHHPDRETQYICMKHKIYLCEECLRCRDPKIYCKFRPGCPIWFIARDNERLQGEESSREAEITSEKMTGLKKPPLG